MKNIKLVAVSIIILTICAFTGNKLINWKIKDGFSVKFSSGMLEGSFSGLKANILFDEEHSENSKISAVIDVRTIKTGSDDGTLHAKEALDVIKFPVITFVSTTIKKSGNAYEATGKLTLKGITKEIKLPFTFDSQKDHTEKFPFLYKETFQGKFTIIPKEYNVTKAGMPAELVIELTIPVTK